MTAYADTSFLVSLYLRDANTAKAEAFMLRHTQPLPFTQLNRVELRNAISRAIFEEKVAPQEARAAWRQVDSDLQAGLLVHQPVKWVELFREAERLAALQTPATGSRTLDILHVSAAISMNARDFLTFDTRQANLATRIGLAVGPDRASP